MVEPTRVSGPHLQFLPGQVERGRKTRIWDVRKGTERLGQVRWWSAWRRYTFWPRAETIYDATCLFQVAGFCAEETRKRKERTEEP